MTLYFSNSEVPALEVWLDTFLLSFDSNSFCTSDETDLVVDFSGMINSRPKASGAPARRPFACSKSWPVNPNCAAIPARVSPVRTLYVPPGGATGSLLVGLLAIVDPLGLGFCLVPSAFGKPFAC